MQTDRQRSLQLLTNVVSKAFDRREFVQLGTHEYTFRKKGETLDDGENLYEARASGIFQKAPKYRGNLDSPPIGYTFLHWGSRDDLEDILKVVCQDMSTTDIDCMMVGIGAGAVLRSMNPDRSKVGQVEESPAL